MRIRLFLLTLITLIAFGAGIIGALLLRHGSLGPGGAIQTTGKALIGGPFALTSHEGKRVTDRDLRGKFALVFFGYSFCPDVCPAELQVISAALDRLGPKAERITPVFITVDPQRDTVEHLAGYVSNFHASLLGLTGTEEEIKAAAKAYRVYYQKVKDDASAADYLMDHSAFTYLMGPDGAYVTHFRYGVTPEQLAEALEKHLDAEGATAALE